MTPHYSAQLAAWFETSSGQRLLNAEIVVLEEVLPQLFGHHLVQIGSVGGGRLLASSRIIHRCITGLSLDHCNSPYSQVYATADQLPFNQESVDVVVLPHILEFEANPHAVLREVERILIPEGQVIILCFNPLSLWGIWRKLTWKQTVPWNAKFLPLLRIKDWLALLDFDLVQQRTFFLTSSWRCKHLTKCDDFLEKIGNRWLSNFGAVYLIVAKKRVIPLTPIPFVWQQAPSLARACHHLN